MADGDVLSRDEVDALINGVDSGEVSTESTAAGSRGANTVDFAARGRVLREGLEGLKVINERFMRFAETPLFELLQRPAEISDGGIELLKYADYIHGMAIPTSINVMKAPPLRGTALVAVDARLVSTVVEGYFGGDGRFPAKIADRDFTPMEQRIVSRVLTGLLQPLAEAWEPVLPLAFERLAMESNPRFVNIVAGREMVVVNKFYIEIDGSGGEFHVTMPQSMLSPVGSLLDAGSSGVAETDERFSELLQREVADAEVELSTVFARRTLSLRELYRIKSGDVIYIDPPEQVTVMAEDVPLFRGVFGQSRGRNAVRIETILGGTATKG